MGLKGDTYMGGMGPLHPLVLQLSGRVQIWLKNPCILKRKSAARANRHTDKMGWE